MSLCPLVSLGMQGSRGMGCRGIEGRLQDSSSLRSSFNVLSRHLSFVRSQFHQGSGSGVGTGGFTVKTGGRACRFFSRLLCTNVRRAEGDRRLEADNRSLGSQQVCKEDAIQDGDSPVSFGLHSSGRLDVFHRPEGRVPSDPHSSGQQASSQVCD